jgi:cytochrome c5
MILKTLIFSTMLILASVAYPADPSPKSDNESASAGASVARNNIEADTMRTQGEQRFSANCSRCHAAPHKFPPRMIATIVRHMRVRATITDEDMRLVIFYMTQ